ncbi:MAG: acyltransferase domain-containing protein, partial [Pseudomonadales bacterium]|nr:acyltransferase domain-containing protein [Pseudomonadales bacterium]
MLSGLAAAYPQIKNSFAEASVVLGYDLWALAQQGPQEDLNLTERTQPLLLTSSVAIWRLWRELGGPVPAMMAGHSLGEYSALVCSEVLAFGDAVDLVRKRGQYMQTAVPVGAGAMAAVLGLDD